MHFLITTDIDELASELGVNIISLALYEFDEIDPNVPITLEYRDKEVIALYGDMMEPDSRYASYKVVSTLDIYQDLVTFPEDREEFDENDKIIISRDSHDQDTVIFRIRRL